MAMADVSCGVKYISGERNGCPRCKTSGNAQPAGGQSRQQRQPVCGFHRLYTEDTLQRREDERAATSPVMYG